MQHRENEKVSLKGRESEGDAAAESRGGNREGDVEGPNDIPERQQRCDKE